MTQTKQEELEVSEDDMNLDPLQVLQEQMVFYRSKSLVIAEMIVTKIKEDKNFRGDQLVALYKQMSRAREMTIKVASELAPYRKPKLQSVEIKSDVEHRFVIRAPDPINTTGEWLKSAGVVDTTPIILDETRAEAIRDQKSIPVEFTDNDLVRIGQQQYITKHIQDEPITDNPFDLDENEDN